MDGLVACTKARDAVRAFLAEGKGNEAGALTSSSEDEIDRAYCPPPQAWLGAGAEFRPEGLNNGIVTIVADRRLRGALRKERAKREENESRPKAISSDEENESRAVVVGKRKRKKRKRKAIEATVSVPDCSEATMAPTPEDKMWTAKPLQKCASDVPVIVAGTSKRVSRVFEAKERAHFESMFTEMKGEATGVGADHPRGTFQGGPAASGGEWKPRKKKKIRSRQKNLRRDKRPKDKLPAHLTEETLRGGRVRHSDVDPAQVAAATP